MKVVTVVGTRPEIIRLAAVMRRLDATDGIEHVVEQSAVTEEGGRLVLPEPLAGPAGEDHRGPVRRVLTGLHRFEAGLTTCAADPSQGQPSRVHDTLIHIATLGSV